VLQWARYYNGSGDGSDVVIAMALDPVTSDVYVTGTTTSANSNDDWITIKYNSVGIQQWVQFYSAIPGSDNIGWAIALDNQDNIYVAGQGSGSNSFSDYITIKYNPDGVLQWAEQNNFSNLISVPSVIAANKFNNVFVTGSVRTYADITADYYDYATIKYVQSTPLSVKAILDTIVYYGYGSNCVQLKAEASGGIEPYIFSWSPGGTTPNNQSTTVCPTKTSVYTVTAIDGKGTTATALVTVKVIDVRCGEKKILVCHNNKDLCVAASAVPAHLQHGDRLGSCSDDIKNGNNPKDVSNSKGISTFTFKAYPNPFRDVSNIIYQLPLDAHVVISLLDLNGRELATITQGKKRAGYYLVPINAEKLPPGVYLCRIIVGISHSQSVHLIKLVVAK